MNKLDEFEFLKDLGNNVTEGEWRFIHNTYKDGGKVVVKKTNQTIAEFDRSLDGRFICKLKNKLEDVVEEYKELSRIIKQVLEEEKQIGPLRINEQATKDLWVELHKKN